ncbi:uncharacterized protein AB675_1258 [Cyphellophora attinorum]|uniref:Uncharacterized protein n=1 Tax=Cyphellophora attinorum TaxID=1664694 RepID=A0A0N0NIH8_9EURO|nr:uncharacterized protein AB675_1258 [Phialophora attinorum]KPI35758.1 hypothetical protein AB675_1258 [Phialophora attinorum]
MRSSTRLTSSAALLLASTPLINASPHPIDKRQAAAPATTPSPSTDPPDATSTENSVLLTIQLDSSLSSTTTLTVPLDTVALSNFMQRATFGTSLTAPGIFCGAFQDTGASVLIGSIFDSAQPGQFQAQGRPSLAESYYCSRNKIAVERRVKETVVVGGEGSYAWKMEGQERQHGQPPVGGGGGGDTVARPFSAPPVVGAGGGDTASRPTVAGGADGGDKGWEPGKGQDPKHEYTHMAGAPQPTPDSGGGDKGAQNYDDKPWEHGQGQDPKHVYTHVQGSAPQPTVAWAKPPQGGQYGGGGGDKGYNPNNQYGGDDKPDGGAPSQPQQTGDAKPWGSKGIDEKTSYQPRPSDHVEEGKGWEQGKGAGPAPGYQHMNGGTRSGYRL